MRSLAALESFRVLILLAALAAALELLEAESMLRGLFFGNGELFFGKGESTSRFHFVEGDLVGLSGSAPALVRLWPPSR